MSSLKISLQQLPYPTQSSHFPIAQKKLQQKVIKNQLLQAYQHANGQETTPQIGNYQLGSAFFSCSYTDNWVGVAFAQTKVGFDIEQIKPRNSSLLHKFSKEIQLFSEGELMSFYRIRTGKEALLKYKNKKNLDLIEEIQLIKVQNISEIIDSTCFDKELTYFREGEEFSVKSFFDQKLVGALIYAQH